MAKFPEPQRVAALRAILAQTTMFEAGTIVARIFFMGGDYPTTWDQFRYFGPTASRFDHHLLNEQGEPSVQKRGIMYLAAGIQSIPTCLAEVFQTSRTIDRQSRHPVLACFALTKDVILLDLRGAFVTAIGASTAIHSDPRPRARRWAQQLYAAYPTIDGLLYCSSMYGNAPAIALFERAKRALPQRPVFHRSLDDPALTYVLVKTGRKIRYAIA